MSLPTGRDAKPRQGSPAPFPSGRRPASLSLSPSALDPAPSFGPPPEPWPASPSSFPSAREQPPPSLPSWRRPASARFLPRPEQPQLRGGEEEELYINFKTQPLLKRQFLERLLKFLCSQSFSELLYWKRWFEVCITQSRESIFLDLYLAHRTSMTEALEGRFRFLCFQFPLEKKYWEQWLQNHRLSDLEGQFSREEPISSFPGRRLSVREFLEQQLDLSCTHSYSERQYWRGWFEDHLSSDLEEQSSGQPLEARIESSPERQLFARDFLEQQLELSYSKFPAMCRYWMQWVDDYILSNREEQSSGQQSESRIRSSQDTQPSRQRQGSPVPSASGRQLSRGRRSSSAPPASRQRQGSPVLSPSGRRSTSPTPSISGRQPSRGRQASANPSPPGRQSTSSTPFIPGWQTSRGRQASLISPASSGRITSPARPTSQRRFNLPSLPPLDPQVSRQRQPSSNDEQYINSRIEALEKLIRDNPAPAQEQNLNAALKIYRDNIIPGGSRYAITWFQDGEIRPLAAIKFDGTPRHREGVARQLCQNDRDRPNNTNAPESHSSPPNTAVGSCAGQRGSPTSGAHSPFGGGQAKQQNCVSYDSFENWHYIALVVRPLPEHPVEAELPLYVLNDTGSNVLNLPIDWVQQNGLLDQYCGLEGRITVETAAGNIEVIHLSVEVQLLSLHGELQVFGPIFRENAIVKDTDTKTLSGSEMREHFYFATPKGNSHLLVAEDKASLVAALPDLQ